MSAIVTGEKTKNGVLSQSASAVRGKQDGEILQTILEHAEQRGLSTGVLTNVTATDATAAACYSHTNDRGKTADIVAQFLNPRFGDGVEVLMGAGRDRIFKATEAAGLKIEASLQEKGYSLHASLDTISGDERRLVGLFNTSDFDIWQAMERALAVLRRNPKGYFLMVEWDAHTDVLKRGLEQAAALDSAIRKTAQTVKGDTLLLFTADHSFDIRVRRGRRGEPILQENGPNGVPPEKANIRVDNGHTGEQVLVAAQGPGAERVRGFISNTDLFRIMMAAYGWKIPPLGSSAAE
jgi:alkaline phosphatase